VTTSSAPSSLADANRYLALPRAALSEVAAEFISGALGQRRASRGRREVQGRSRMRRVTASSSYGEHGTGVDREPTKDPGPRRLGALSLGLGTAAIAGKTTRG
jgi:hypothetical protein